MKGVFADQAGQTYGRLTGIRKADGRKYLWKCACGTEKVIQTRHVISGATRSCGCLLRETTAKRMRTHGHTVGSGKERGSDRRPPSRTYRIWANMLTRCHNPKAPQWIDYGSRGVSVCDQWRTSFAQFLADMGEAPPDCSIDRIDNNGNYEPSNCRWATAHTQARNRRSNRRLTAWGETKTLSGWAQHCGLHPTTIHNRLERGWALEAALSEPALPYRRF